MTPRARTIQLPPFHVQAALGAADDKARTVELVFSTGAAFLRADPRTGQLFNFKFSLNSEHVRLDRLNNGAPLLNAHSSLDLSKQVGVVVERSANVNGREARCTVRFSQRPEVEPIWQDVRDGIIRNVSVGASVHRFEEHHGADDELATRTAIDWEPFEVSLVPIGADDGAKVKASAATVTNPCVVVQAARSPDRARAHVAAVFAACNREGLTELASFLVANTTTVAEIHAQIERAKAMQQVCAEAGFGDAPSFARGFIETPTMTVADARELLAEARAAVAKHWGHEPPKPTRASLSEIYAERNEAHNRAQFADETPR